jgi:hypothetical protein
LTAPDLQNPAIRRLIVTGHPNHELAILGLVQRLRPRFLFLTDGGGAERVAETRSALDSLGLLAQARFLSWPETRLYRALLDHDLLLFDDLVAAVRSEIEDCAAQQVFCESVEFYNPLHDVTLPIAMAAARGLHGVEIVEFPLIAQEPAAGERYRVQRFPAGNGGQANRSSAPAAAGAPIAPAKASEAVETLERGRISSAGRRTVSLRLTPAELAVKLAARTDHYSCLRRQLGAVLDDIGEQHAAVEEFRAAPSAIPAPGADYVLRYEWRGRSLQERREVERVITYREHFLPLVAALAG